MASSGWDVYKKYVVKPGMPEPTWAQPILKMRKIAKAVRRYIFGLMDGDTPAYKTWDEVFEAGREGKLGERGIVEAKNKFQRSFWMGGTENRFYEFGPNYGKQPDIDYEPATPTPDPSEIPNLMKRVNERIDEGNVSFREAVKIKLRGEIAEVITEMLGEATINFGGNTNEVSEGSVGREAHKERATDEEKDSK